MAAVLLVSHGSFLVFPGIFEPLSARATDRLFALRSGVDSLRPAYDDTIVRVDIDDYSRAALGAPRLGRIEIARVVRNLQRASVAAQFLDVIFVEPETPQADRELIDATVEAGNVYYGVALGLSAGADLDAPPEPQGPHEIILDRNRWRPRVEGDASRIPRSTRYFLPFAELAGEARGVGFLDIAVDRDGVFRRAPLLIRDGDGLVPSLSLRVVSDYLGVDPARIVVKPGRSITLPDARRPGRTEVEDIVVPVDRHGNLIVNYIGPYGSMKHYPFSHIYLASDDRTELEDLRLELAGKIVLVAWAATGTGDIGAVPVEPLFPLSGIHANVMHSILTQDFLRPASTAEMVLWVELPLLAVLFAAALRLRTLGFVLVPPVLVLIYIASAAAVFLKFRWIVDIPGPIIVVALSTFLIAFYEYHREATARAILRHNFNAYFPPPVVDKIMRRPAALESAAQKRELTILFSDIRNFTRHTSTMEAARVRDLLNEYFEKMVEIVFEHGGTLDKFIGDGLMVFFGDPERQPDHALRGVRAAVAMQAATRELEAAWRERGEMPLQIRIGINTGQVIVGNMGSPRRLSYTVLGEPVNMAQRLEAGAPAGGILISQRTRELIGKSVPTRATEPIMVKGIDHPLVVYEVDAGPPGSGARG